MRANLLCQLLCIAILVADVSAGEAPARLPVIFDTDIGTDIDDAYALAALIHRPELDLRGVTTVSSDAQARARLAAKLLHVAGERWSRVPVWLRWPAYDALILLMLWMGDLGARSFIYFQF